MKPEGNVMLCMSFTARDGQIVGGAGPSWRLKSVLRRQTFESSVWNLLHAIFLVIRILKVVPQFFENLWVPDLKYEGRRMGWGYLRVSLIHMKRTGAVME